MKVFGIQDPICSPFDESVSDIGHQGADDKYTVADWAFSMYFSLKKA